MNIKHFFIKDRIAAGELNVEHCGTDDMIADYFTKPLQGEKFRCFRDLILGIKDIDSTDQIRSVLEKDLVWLNLNGSKGNNKYPMSDEMSDTTEQRNESMKRVTWKDDIHSS